MTIATEHIVTAPTRETMLPSVLVAVMGPYPMESEGISTTQHLMDMCVSTAATGSYEVNMVCIPDMVDPAIKVDPLAEDRETALLGDGVGKMRQWAVAQADALGYDALFLVENDAAVKRDTLSRLLKGEADIMIPSQSYMLTYFPPVYSICWKPRAPIGSTGYMDIEWCVFTALLIKRQAFSRLDPFFMGYDGEGEEYTRWAAAGTTIVMDLDTIIDVLKLPRGYNTYSSIPFHQHTKLVDGEPVTCEGTMSEVFANNILDIWACSEDNYCGYLVSFNNRRNKS